MSQDLLARANLLEQAHVALGSATKLEDFYVILASVLVDPVTFGFSRAFFFLYDERRNLLTSRLAVGGRNAAEHTMLREAVLAEAESLEATLEAIRKTTAEPHAVQPLYNLRYHSLWIQMMQSHEAGDSLDEAFVGRTIALEPLPSNHVLKMGIQIPSAQRIDADQPVAFDGVDEQLAQPMLIGALHSKSGVHGLWVVDRLYDGTEISDERFYQFQLVLNHASVMLDNVVLVEELTDTAAKLREMDRIKTNFLSICSHELRTPLTSILGFSQLVADEKVGKLEPAPKDLLKRVVQHAQHLQSMVNDLLEIAEVEAGGMASSTLQPVDPLAALYAVIPKIIERRSTKPVTIEPDIRGEVPEVLCDPQTLQRIFFHLIDNAVKFCKETAEVRVLFDRRGDVLEITIADNGIGISPEHLKRIFDQFYQVDYRLDRAYGGMGIGLTVVKLLLQSCKAQIRAESTVNKGSRFTLSIPIA